MEECREARSCVPWSLRVPLETTRRERRRARWVQSVNKLRLLSRNRRGEEGGGGMIGGGGFPPPPGMLFAFKPYTFLLSNGVHFCFQTTYVSAFKRHMIRL